MAEHSRESERATREMTRAAEEVSKAARDLRRAFEQSARDYERHLAEISEAQTLMEEMRRHQSALRSAPELPEEEVALIADKSVHRVRRALARERGDRPKAPPPTTEEIEDWERRREERRKREAS